MRFGRMPEGYQTPAKIAEREWAAIRFESYVGGDGAEGAYYDWDLCCKPGGRCLFFMEPRHTVADIRRAAEQLILDTGVKDVFFEYVAVDHDLARPERRFENEMRKSK